MGEYQWGFDVALRWFPYVVSGVWKTILITLGAMGIGLIFGVFISIFRVVGKQPWAGLAKGYTEFFRNTPMYTQLIWVYYAIPVVLGWTPASIVAALAALSLNVGAFVAEIIRAGITSIGPGQRDAALALGMREPQVYRRIILPQALTKVIPPLASIWVSMFKETSIVSLVGIGDLMFRARFGAYRTYRTIEMFSMVSLIYLVLTWPQSRFSDWLYEKFRVK